MKNFYEILEINEKASPEIVEKAYKVLVKKYHPDLQTDLNKKKECEAKIKEINEAYETLSNADLRAEYDNQLKQEQFEYEQARQAQTQAQSQQANSQYQDKAQEVYNYRVNQQVNNNQQPEQPQYNENAKQQYDEQYRRYEEQYQNAVNKAYHDAYIKRLKDMGYRIKYKKTPKQHFQTVIITIITIAIIFLICQIPFVKDYLRSLYEGNDIIRWIVDLFMNLFNMK